MRRLLSSLAAGVAVLAAVAGGGGPARAGLALTAAGTAEGFTLSTFADGFPSQGGFGTVGPVGITFTNSGGVMVSSYANGKVAVFATDTDGQHYSGAALSASNYGGNNAAGLASSGGNIYMALQGSGQVVQVDQSGNFVRTVVAGDSLPTGMATNPNNGHLFVSAFGNGIIYDVDPVANTQTPFENVQADGLTANSTDLYAEVGQHILGFHLSNGQQFFDSGFISGADGAAVGTGTLAGKLFVNTNFGQVVEVDIATDTQTVIATGGSRGDLVTVDPNGSLLLTQTDSVLRLTAPAGGSFGPQVVPEPTSMVLAGTGVLGLFGYGWTRRRRPAPATDGPAAG